MTASRTNPLLSHPAFAHAAREIGGGELGRLLSIYASGRTKRRAVDPLVRFGVPLLDYVLTALDASAVSVMATTEGVAARQDDGWFLIVRFSDGLVATIDLGAFLPDVYPVETELRLEVCGSERVVVVDPDNVAVTVTGRDGTRRDHAYAGDWYDRFEDYGQHVIAADGPVARLIDAARRSASTGEVVSVT